MLGVVNTPHVIPQSESLAHLEWLRNGCPACGLSFSERYRFLLPVGNKLRIETLSKQVSARFTEIDGNNHLLGDSTTSLAVTHDAI